MTTGTHVTTSINWPQLSREVNAPASAQSFIVLIHDGALAGGDLTVRGDRGETPNAHARVYTSSQSARRANLNYVMEFYAQPGLAGPIVARATGSVNVTDRSGEIEAVDLVGSIKTVTIPAGQTIRVGTMKDFNVQPRGDDGRLIPVNPNSVFWSIISGGNHLDYTAGRFKGMSNGSATIAAEIDGVESSVATVQVTGSGSSEG